ncbi:MAG: glycosyltransferase family 4 protein [Ginsengibacter sp.]
MEQGVEIEYIDNLQSLSHKNLKFRLLYLFYNKIFKKNHEKYEGFYEPANLRFIAKQVEKKLKNKKGGIVFSPGTIPIAYLKTDKPIVFWTDATFAVMKDYYLDFVGLNKRTIKNSNRYEKQSIEKASLAIYSSTWAAESAINDYGANPEKVKVISYGANIECKRTESDILNNNKEKSKNICKLLFVGQEWERKGADAAVRVAEELNKNNINSELYIVGCTPPDNLQLPEFIKVKGFIKKSEKEGENLMNKLYNQSHFFILPTLAECTPIVFSEANSFGLPVITTNTGGISSIIKNDINGRMFGENMDVSSAVSYISDIFKNFDKYQKYSLKAFREYQDRLNWQSSATKCLSYMKDLKS